MENKKITVVAIVVVVVLVVVFSFFLSRKDNVMVNAGENLLGINYDVNGNETDLVNYDTKNPVVCMYIEGYGSIVIELYPDVALNTVNNFISLVKKGFYDNNSFHRLVPGFVLQGGDPTGTGTGGPGYTIEGEFSQNKIKNNLEHKKGIVSMARSQDFNSAGSQFFIMLDDNHSLDGAYAAFGKVIDGFSNIENIARMEQVSDSMSGSLRNNLRIKKALLDLNEYKYQDVIKY